MEQTSDPDVVILERGLLLDGTPTVQYQRLSTGLVWTVGGVCNQCGLCVLGAAETGDYLWSGEPGTPLAVVDLRFGHRLDEPVTPGFFEDMARMAEATPTATVAGCSLSLVD